MIFNATVYERTFLALEISTQGPFVVVSVANMHHILHSLPEHRSVRSFVHKAKLGQKTLEDFTQQNTKKGWITAGYTHHPHLRAPETCVGVNGLSRESPAALFIHCSKQLKEHFENTSDLNVKKYYVGYLYWYGQFNVLGTKGCHIFWWK